MTRSEHLNWCKQRALEYVDAGDLDQAVASMASDLTKHPDTANTPPMLTMLGMMEIANGPNAVRRWVEGFN